MKGPVSKGGTGTLKKSRTRKNKIFLNRKMALLLMCLIASFSKNSLLTKKKEKSRIKRKKNTQKIKKECDTHQ